MPSRSEVQELASASARAPRASLRPRGNLNRKVSLNCSGKFSSCPPPYPTAGAGPLGAALARAGGRGPSHHLPVPLPLRANRSSLAGKLQVHRSGSSGAVPAAHRAARIARAAPRGEALCCAAPCCAVPAAHRAARAARAAPRGEVLRCACCAVLCCAVACHAMLRRALHFRFCCMCGVVAVHASGTWAACRACLPWACQPISYAANPRSYQYLDIHLLVTVTLFGRPRSPNQA